MGSWHILAEIDQDAFNAGDYDRMIERGRLDLYFYYRLPERLADPLIGSCISNPSGPVEGDDNNAKKRTAPAKETCKPEEPSATAILADIPEFDQHVTSPLETAHAGASQDDQSRPQGELNVASQTLPIAAVPTSIRLHVSYVRLINKIKPTKWTDENFLLPVHSTMSTLYAAITPEVHELIDCAKFEDDPPIKVWFWTLTHLGTEDGTYQLKPNKTWRLSDYIKAVPDWCIPRTDQGEMCLRDEVKIYHVSRNKAPKGKLRLGPPEKCHMGQDRAGTGAGRLGAVTRAPKRESGCSPPFNGLNEFEAKKRK
jgi:hypothetical protein